MTWISSASGLVGNKGVDSAWPCTARRIRLLLGSREYPQVHCVYENARKVGEHVCRCIFDGYTDEPSRTGRVCRFQAVSL